MKRIACLVISLCCGLPLSAIAAQPTLPALPKPVRAPAQIQMAPLPPPPVLENFLGAGVKLVADDKAPLSDLTKTLNAAQMKTLLTDIGEIAARSRRQLGVVILEESPVESVEDAARDRFYRWFNGSGRSGVIAISLSQKRMGMALGADFAESAPESRVQEIVIRALQSNAKPGAKELERAIGEIGEALPVDPVKIGQRWFYGAVGLCALALLFMVLAIRRERRTRRLFSGNANLLDVSRFRKS